VAGVQFTEKGRQIIRERAKDKCELCGTPAAETAQIHHRKPSGMGGTKNPTSRLVNNGLFVHFRCHQRIELNRAEALKNGWLVLQSGDLSQPVLLHYGWVVLHEDGSVYELGDLYQLPQQPSVDPEDSTHQSVERNDG
jgi:5-methylcytosine-specific restriction enzyme A